MQPQPKGACIMNTLTGHSNNRQPNPPIVSGEDARRRALAQGLYPHPVEGVAFLLGRRGAILADDISLGKTRQAVLAMTEAAPNGPWLVVCPACVKLNWAREIELARPGSAVHIIGQSPPDEFPGWVVVNYDLLGKHIDDLLW